MPSQIQDVPVDSLSCRAQVRERAGFGESELAGLAASIKESGGIHTPLLVRRVGDALIVLDGERRLRAAKLLRLARVPVLVTDETLSEDEVVHRQLVLDAQRVGLGPLERAKAIERLMTLSSWNSEQVARKLGLSPATVSRSLALLKLPEPIQAQVERGGISADAAYHLARVDDPQEQESLAAEAAGRMLSRDALTRKLKRARRAEEADRSGVVRTTALIGGGRAVTFTGKGLTLDSMIEWLEPLLARARKAKAQGLTLHTFIRTLKDQASS